MRAMQPHLDFSNGLPDESRVIVTGGSGFIGTNLVERYQSAGTAVANLDLAPPRNRAHRNLWTEADIRRSEDLRSVMQQFRPTHIFHLAARTDLLGRALSDYTANTVG